MDFFNFYQRIRSKLIPQLKLCWEYDTNHFKTWMMSEVTKNIVYDLEKWQEQNEEQLPFHSLFGPQETRKVIPFNSDPLVDGILKKIKDSGLTIDFHTGTVTDGKRATRLGKYLLDKKSKFTEEEKNWWNRSRNPIKELEVADKTYEYAIIVSRNPIDIVRMSDHDGWSSCHAPSREYFQCAISDAKGGGAVAYVVKKDDLNQIQDLQASEIFKDKNRNIYGITPLARVRLRKFVHKKEDYDLAVPEDRIYGKQFPGLKESVRKWALNSQQDKLKGERVRLKDFNLMGGSYQDTSGSDLFNYFFGDDLDYGQADYGGEDDYSSMYDQYEEEIRLIERQYQNFFTICSFYADIHEGDENPYVFYGGTVLLEIPQEFMIPNQKIDRSIESVIEKWAKNNDIYSIQNIDVNNNKVSIHISDDDQDGHPDSFRGFLAGTLTDIEKNKEKLQNGIYHLFVQLGLAKPSRTYQIANELDDEIYQFQHFDIDEEGSSIKIQLKEPIQLPEAKKTAGGYQHEYGYWQDQFKTNLMKSLNSWADKLLETQKRQKSLFPGSTEYKRAFSQEFYIKPEISIRTPSNWERKSLGVSVGNNKNQKISMYMNFEFKPFDQEAHVDDAINFINFLDKNYEKFYKLVLDNYQYLANQWR